MFTKVNRGGFREIRTGVGRAVKTRTDARRGIWSSFARTTKDTKLSDSFVTKNIAHDTGDPPLITNARIYDIFKRE